MKQPGPFVVRWFFLLSLLIVVVIAHGVPVSARLLDNLTGVYLVRYVAAQPVELALGRTGLPWPADAAAGRARDYQLWAMRLKPSDHGVFMGAGYLSLVRGEYAQAATWLREGIAARPQIVRLFLGQALYYAGQPSQAAQVWRQADGMVPYLQRLADYQRVRGLVAEAAVTREQAALIAPDSVGAWNDLGAIYINLQNWEASLAAYRRALEVAPGDVEANLGAARVLFAGYQDASAARRYVQDALAVLASQSAPDETQLGRAYTMMGRLAAYEERFDEAIGWYSETMRLPGYPKAESSLEIARMYQALGDSEAMAYWIGRAVAEAPDVDWIWCAAGDLYRLERDYARAIQVYQHAVDLSPDNVRYRLLLADALGQSGNVDQAIVVYRQALALDPTNQVAIEGLRRLEGLP